MAQANEHPGRIATLILPGDSSWREAGEANALPPAVHHTPKAPDLARIEAVAKVLRSGEPVMLVLGNKSTRGRALELAGRIAAGTGCRLGTQFFSARIERGAGRTPLERIPYAVALATEFLKDVRHIVTVETREPVAFFSYPDKPSLLKAEGALVHPLVEADEDSALGFEMLIEALGLRNTAPLVQALVETPAAQRRAQPCQHCPCAGRSHSGRLHRRR